MSPIASTRQTPVDRPACGHHRHVGCCSACQRHQQARWARQAAEVEAILAARRRAA